MHQSVEESAVGKHHGFCPESRSERSLNAHNTRPGKLRPLAVGQISYISYISLNLSILKDQLSYGILPETEVLGILENMAPHLGEAHAIALRTRAPHGRTFRAVEHAELDGRAVRHNSHHSAESIYFPDNLTFGYTADGRIATHLGNFIQIDGNQKGTRPQTCRRRGSLTSGVTGTHYYHIVVERHFPIVIFSTVLEKV